MASSPFDTSDQGASFTPLAGASFTPIQAEFGPTSPPHASAAASFHFLQEHRTVAPRHNDSLRACGPSRASRPPSATPKVTQSSLDLAAMELLHHFVAVTSDAITPGLLGHELWKNTIPKLALSHEWLMHSLLAISALHIAHLNPEQQDVYRERAAINQDQALQGQQIALANPSFENGDALYASTITTIYLAFASPKASPGPNEVPLNQVVQCLHMLRGISAITSAVGPYTKKGVLSSLSVLHPGNIKSNPTFSDPAIETQFSKLLIFSSTTCDLNGDLELNDVCTYAAAASSLRASFLKFESIPEGSTPSPAIWYWAVRLPALFVSRVSEKQVVPLILIAHWCVLLTHVPYLWWIQGWVDQTLSEIEGNLPLEQHQWLRWPHERISGIRAKQADGAT